MGLIALLQEQGVRQGPAHGQKAVAGTWEGGPGSHPAPSLHQDPESSRHTWWLSR